MAIHKPIDGILKNRDIRVLRVFRDSLLREYAVRGAVRWGDAERYLSDINEALIQRYPDMSLRDKFISDRVKWCRSHLVSKSEIDWIENNDKACAWLWLVRLVLEYRGENDDHQNAYTRTYGCSELGFNLVPVPSSHQDRVNLMVEYLDRVSCDTTIRNEIIAELKDVWLVIVNSNDLLKWIDRGDEEQCKWVWGCFRKEVIPQLYSGGVRPNVDLLPMNSSEMYLFSYAVFYAWQGSEAEKELLVRKMKNAWGQKKFRRKKAAKRSINTYIDPVVGEKLDELVFHYDLTIHRTIEMLIKKEYERLKDKGI